MTSYFDMTKMTEDQLEQELLKAKRRSQKAKEDIGIIKSFLKLKSFEAENRKPKTENKESGKSENGKPEKSDDEILTIDTVNYID